MAAGKYANRTELLADFGKHAQLLIEVQGRYRSMQTNTARALNAFKLGSKSRADMLAKMDPDDLFTAGTTAMETLAKRIVATGGDPKAMGQVLRPDLLQKIAGTASEFWINGLLAGPKTVVVNVLGSTLHAAYVPAEKMLAGALRAGTKGREEFVQGAAEYAGLVMSIRESLSMAATPCDPEREDQGG